MNHGPETMGATPALPEQVPAVEPEQAVTDRELVHRYSYHGPSGEAVAIHQRIRDEFAWFSQLLNQWLPEGRSKTRAHDALEEASFHAHASIAREPSLHSDQPAS